MADDELVRAIAGEPVDYPGVDRFVAEAVADRDDALSLSKRLLEAEVLVGEDRGLVREDLVEGPSQEDGA